MIRTVLVKYDSGEPRAGEPEVFLHVKAGTAAPAFAGWPLAGIHGHGIGNEPSLCSRVPGPGERDGRFRIMEAPCRCGPGVVLSFFT